MVVIAGLWLLISWMTLGKTMSAVHDPVTVLLAGITSTATGPLVVEEDGKTTSSCCCRHHSGEPDVVNLDHQQQQQKHHLPAVVGTTPGNPTLT